MSRADPSRSRKRNLRSTQQQRVRQKHHLRWAEGEGWSPARRRMASRGTLWVAFSGRGAICVCSVQCVGGGTQGRRRQA